MYGAAGSCFRHACPRLGEVRTVQAGVGQEDSTRWHTQAPPPLPSPQLPGALIRTGMLHGRPVLPGVPVLRQCHQILCLSVWLLVCGAVLRRGGAVRTLPAVPPSGWGPLPSRRFHTEGGCLHHQPQRMGVGREIIPGPQEGDSSFSSTGKPTQAQRKVQ